MDARRMELEMQAELRQMEKLMRAPQTPEGKQRARPFTAVIRSCLPTRPSRWATLSPLALRSSLCSLL